MPLTDTSTIILVVALVVVAALLVWLSLSMAAAESAVGRVTRAGLNNKILEVQTDTETSQFIRMKKIGKIHTVQRLITNRYATSGSCAFFRITCNVFDGVLVACVASLLDAPIWLQLLCGFLFALIVGIVSVLVRPRSAGASKPIDIMLNLAGLVRFATAITPFAKAGEQKGQKRRSKESDLSDDEELEKIQLEQGRATIDRLVEANDFDPEVSEMLRNVLTLSETLTPRDHGASHRHDLHGPHGHTCRHAASVLPVRFLPRAGDRRRRRRSDRRGVSQGRRARHGVQSRRLAARCRLHCQAADAGSRVEAGG